MTHLIIFGTWLKMRPQAVPRLSSGVFIAPVFCTTQENYHVTRKKKKKLLEILIIFPEILK